MDATTQVKEEHAKAKAARAELRQARKALRTYEAGAYTRPLFGST
jgi:hypothetical protein